MKRKYFSGFNIIHFSDKKKIVCSSVLERDYLSESLTNIKRETLHCFLGSRASFKLKEVLQYPLIIIIDLYEELHQCFVHSGGSGQKKSVIHW